MAETKNEVVVVKVQRSLATNAPEGEQVLIYDATREFQYQGPMPQELRKRMGDRAKMYCLAELVPNKDEPGTFQFSIAQEAPAQSW